MLNSIFSKEHSDLDLTIITTSGQKHAAIIQQLFYLLRPDYPDCQVLTLASGCILTFTDEENDIEVDIAVNKVLEL